ncbi:MAG: RnfABCDGE type electron transport complex subunit B, partial [Proteobacteria bacterium]|nr:RnfABCDGE type electron transport complex subunit B [Pseudomonadota bacterium]
MLIAILTIGLMAGLFGLILGYAAIRFKVEGNPVVDRIDALLPQTQCGQCTFAGCRPYAEAIAKGAAPINQCPPGGHATIVALASLLDGLDILLLCGTLRPLAKDEKIFRHSGATECRILSELAIEQSVVVCLALLYDGVCPQYELGRVLPSLILMNPDEITSEVVPSSAAMTPSVSNSLLAMNDTHSTGPSDAVELPRKVAI